jgi:hypothetical protein
MKQDSVLELPTPEMVTGTSKARNVLEEIVRQGAIQLLQQAIENEVAEYLERHQQERDENGRQLAVRNGHLPQREILSGIGPLPVRQPRVRQRDGSTKFSSAILPPYLRRLPSVEALIPALYLISQGCVFRRDAGGTRSDSGVASQRLIGHQRGATQSRLGAGV